MGERQPDVAAVHRIRNGRILILLRVEAVARRDLGDHAHGILKAVRSKFRETSVVGQGHTGHRVQQLGALQAGRHHRLALALAGRDRHGPVCILIPGQPVDHVLLGQPGRKVIQRLLVRDHNVYVK